MSKCQARKYLAGGRCGGSTFSSVQKEDTGVVNTSFQQLLAQREAMDAKMWAPPTQETITHEPKQQSLVVIEKTVVTKPQQKQSDIDCILGNDFK